MPEVFTPMSLEDAICWEMGLAFAIILGTILMVIFVGTILVIVASIIGSIVLLALAIMSFKNREYSKAAFLLVIWVVCLSISSSVYGELKIYNQKRLFQKQVVKENQLPFCEGSSISDAPNKYLLWIETKEGKTVLADSLQQAASGDGRVLSAKDKKVWLEKSIKSQVLGRIQSQYCGPIDREFLDCRLGSDLTSLTVFVKSRWKSFSQRDRVNNLEFYYRYLWNSLGYSFGSPDHVIKVQVYGQDNRLIAFIQTNKDNPFSKIVGLHDQRKNTFWWMNPRIVRLEFSGG